jgi:hypothetical protein
MRSVRHYGLRGVCRLVWLELRSDLSKDRNKLITNPQSFSYEVSHLRGHDTPCYFPIRLGAGFPLSEYQRKFLVPGIFENRHRFTAVYRLGPLAAEEASARPVAWLRLGGLGG